MLLHLHIQSRSYFCLSQPNYKHVYYFCFVENKAAYFLSKINNGNSILNVCNLFFPLLLWVVSNNTNVALPANDIKLVVHFQSLEFYLFFFIVVFPHFIFSKALKNVVLNWSVTQLYLCVYIPLFRFLVSNYVLFCN